MQKTNPKLWKKEEDERVLKEWKSLNKKEKEKFAKSLGRSYSSVLNRYNRIKPDKKRKYEKKEEKKPAKIEVTHLTKEIPVRNSVIHLDDVKVEIPSKSFSINGVKIEW